MEIAQLAAKLNEAGVGYEVAHPANAEVRARMFATILKLVDLFVKASPEERLAVLALSETAKYAMSYFTEVKTLEARRTRSRETLVEALIPVVMAGGRSESRTGGLLLAMVCRSAEAAGLDTNELFDYGAQ